MLTAIVFPIIFSIFVSATTDPVQKAALVDLFKATNGSTSWIRKWNLDTDPCDSRSPWFGVQCAGMKLFVAVSHSGGPNIYALTVQKNKMAGQLPASMVALKYMQFLYLSNNNLHGSLPDIFASMTTTLLHLGLDENSLTGPIPTSLGRCQNLQSLFLQKNAFSGPIAFLGTLTNLQIAYLSHNKFSGAIPQGLTQITSLQQIGLDDNQLSGDLPSGFVTNQNQLISFFAQNNSISGVFDENLCALQNCDFSNNAFHCPVPNCCNVGC